MVNQEYLQTECNVPGYQRPSITTYTAADLLSLVGPAQAGPSTTNEDNFLSPPTGYYAPEDDDDARIS